MVTVVQRRAGSWVGKMSRALMFVGPWVVLGSLAENSEKKKCAGMFHVKSTTIIKKLWNSPEVSEMTVKSKLNSRKCLKICWVCSNLEFTWDFVHSRRLPAKPQLNSRSIDFTLTNLTFVNNKIHDLY
jgi:hypothetical protein